jgi:hypothetical protein
MQVKRVQAQKRTYKMPEEPSQATREREREREREKERKKERENEVE